MITIIILPAPGALTLAQKETLGSDQPVFIQTRLHPSADFLTEQKIEHIRWMTYFSRLKILIRSTMQSPKTLQLRDCANVATGNNKQQQPVIGKHQNHAVRCSVLPHLSVGEVAFPERETAISISAHDLPELIDPEQNYTVDEIDSRIAAGEVKLFLSEYYPDESIVSLASIRKNDSYMIKEIKLCDLDRLDFYDATTILYIAKTNFENRTRHGFDDVMRIVRRLRAPNGCPWDREQTHESLKNARMKESNEQIDAIDDGDDAHICEDMACAAAVCTACRNAGEQSALPREILYELVENQIYRTTCIGDIRVNGSDEVLKNWDALKMSQRKQTTQTEVLKSVPKSFPALLRSRKVQKKAADVGFDWENAQQAFYKIAEETEELRESIEQGSNIDEEMGDLLFAVVNVARLLKMEPEFLLMQATDKFINRFEKMELLARDRGNELKELSFHDQDQLWDEAKKCRITE
jgi:tetrapyrrole methylase family protein/MazG family protein